MQITNSVTSITGPNRYSTALSVTNTTLNTSNPRPTAVGPRSTPPCGHDNTVTPTTTNTSGTPASTSSTWLDLATTNPAALAPDAMVATLDELLCYGNMSQPTFRAITRALNRQDDPFASGISDSGSRPAHPRPPAKRHPPHHHLGGLRRLEINRHVRSHQPPRFPGPIELRRRRLARPALHPAQPAHGRLRRRPGPPPGEDYRALVCLFFAGGMDSYNLLVPTAGSTVYNNYLTTRGGLYDPRPISTDSPSAACRSPRTPPIPSVFGVHPKLRRSQRPARHPVALRLGKTRLRQQRRHPRRAHHQDAIQQLLRHAPARPLLPCGPGPAVAHLRHHPGPLARLGRFRRRSPPRRKHQCQGLHEHFPQRKQHLADRQQALLLQHRHHRQHPAHPNTTRPTPLPSISTTSRTAIRTAAIDNLLQQEYQNLLDQTFTQNLKDSIEASAAFTDAFDRQPRSPLCFPVIGYVPPVPIPRYGHTSTAATIRRGISASNSKPSSAPSRSAQDPRPAPPDLLHQLRRLGPPRRGHHQHGQAWWMS